LTGRAARNSVWLGEPDLVLRVGKIVFLTIAFVAGGLVQPPCFGVAHCFDFLAKREVLLIEGRSAPHSLGCLAPGDQSPAINPAAEAEQKPYDRCLHRHTINADQCGALSPAS
jgi:hypothetical protein